MKFEIIRANIADISADAIVCPSNILLKEGPGAAEAIYEAAGRRRLTNACKNIHKVYLGTAAPTPAFDLDAKYILHAIVPRWVDGKHNEYELLCSTYISVLRMADDQLRCKSIAIPLLASGNNGYELELAFEIAEKCILSYKPTNIDMVKLIIYGERIKELVEGLGFDVIEMPVNILELQGDLETLETKRRLKKQAKKTFEKILKEDCERALKAVENTQVRDAIYAAGFEILKSIVFKTVKK